MTKELFHQAIKEKLPSLGAGAYSALPNDMGRAMKRYEELCNENGICPKCQEDQENCLCERISL